MRYAVVRRILGLLLLIFSTTFFIPLGIAAWYREPAFTSFFHSFGLTLGMGMLLFFSSPLSWRELKTKEGFLVVVLFWTVLSLFGALPFYLSSEVSFSGINALFEATSGITTTGATVIHHLDSLSHSLLYYRQQLQFLGGMGIVILAVAVLPLLGAGGMQLYQVEMPGPLKEAKMTPRIAESAKALWLIYVGLTVLCALFYGAAGMTFLEAIGESFGTVATGGFSLHDQSLGYYSHAVIPWIATVFMVLSASNYALHYHFLKTASFRPYWEEKEWRVMIGLLGVGIGVIGWQLWSHGNGESLNEVVRDSVFSTTSLLTTTGLIVTPIPAWPTFLPFLLLLLSLIGGCSTSTSGGIKIMRVFLLKKQGVQALKRLLHPKAIFAAKWGEQTLSEQLIQNIWGFIAIFSMTYCLLLMGLLATGLSWEVAIGTLSACLSNTGTSVVALPVGYVGLAFSSKLLLIFAMLAGRLEILPLLLLFIPEFWRK